MTDSRVASLAALLDDMPTEQAQAWVDGDAAPAAEWLLARGVQYAPREPTPRCDHCERPMRGGWFCAENHPVVWRYNERTAAEELRDRVGAAQGLPTAYARLEEIALEYTDSGDCMECGAEVCRNVAHDADCVIGHVAAALDRSVDFGAGRGAGHP